MFRREIAGAEFHRCTGCSSVFLARSELSALGEAENDWHLESGPRTEPLPRITADMPPPPAAPAKARSFLESLAQA